MDWFVVGIPTQDEDHPIVAYIADAEELPKVPVGRVLTTAGGGRLVEDDEKRFAAAASVLRAAWRRDREIPF